MDVSGLVSCLDAEPGSELPFATPVDQSSFVDVSGLVSGVFFELVSELPFAAPVDQIELRRCLWFRFWSRF